MDGIVVITPLENYMYYHCIVSVILCELVT